MSGFKRRLQPATGLAESRYLPYYPAMIDVSSVSLLSFFLSFPVLLLASLVSLYFISVLEQAPRRPGRRAEDEDAVRGLVGDAAARIPVRPCI